MKKIFTIAALCAVLTVWLTGCSTQILKELAREAKNFEERHSNKETPAPAPAVYCYSTLGIVTCYDRPQSESETSKFVGTTAIPIERRAESDQIPGETRLDPPAKAEDIIPDINLDAPATPAAPAVTPIIVEEEQAPPANKPFRPDFAVEDPSKPRQIIPQAPMGLPDLSRSGASAPYDPAVMPTAEPPMPVNPIVPPQMPNQPAAKP